MTRTGKACHAVAVGFVLFGIVTTVLVGQETTGGIEGVVTDPSGARLPGVKLDITSSSLIRPLAVISDSAGAYFFPVLPPGDYVLDATMEGFRKYQQTNIHLQIGKMLRLDIQMELRHVEESLVVGDDRPLIDFTQSKVASNITEEMFDRLPKPRNFDSLIPLTPGARREILNGGYQIDGASGAENVFILDGVEVTDIQTGTLPAASSVPFEFVHEIQVKSSGFEAQYGGATGGVVNAVVRSGGNVFHGQASFYLTGSALQGAPRPHLKLNPFDDNKVEYVRETPNPFWSPNPGFSLGGPIRRDRLWLFASYFPQFTRTSNTVTFLRDNSTGHFVSRTSTHFLTGKLDFAPSEKLRTSFTYIYSPEKTHGYLPSRDGTDSPETHWDQQGHRSPASTYAFATDYTASSRWLLSLRGGYNYRNYKDYGIVRGTTYVFENSNYKITRPDGQPLPVPRELQGPAGFFSPVNYQTLFNVHSRFNLSADVSYFGRWRGAHQLKFGYQTNRLHNSVNLGFSDGAVDIYWNDAWQGITVQGPFRGLYGYYISIVKGTYGNVSSSNTALFVQDSWQLNSRMTLNLGLRTEREYVPSYRTDAGISSQSIEFGFGQKLAPRLGFAWDPTGRARLKVFGGFGLFYDLMKYQLPLGLFGGDRWIESVYTLDDPVFTKIRQGNTPGTLIETIDYRIPSNDPRDNRIDPSLRPMRERALDLGFEQALTLSTVLTTRYVRKRLDCAVEDVGQVADEGIEYFIANPGFGLTAEPDRLGQGIPPTPRAKRNYDALEIRIERRFTNKLAFSASYVYSRLYGNYGGLVNTDYQGVVSPNTTRYFDLPFMSYNSHGRPLEGPLPTDRPHAFKLYGSYLLKTPWGKTNFAPNFYLFSGTPLTTVVSMTYDAPVFVNGHGDIGRTPLLSNTDFLLSHEFKLSRSTERYSARVECNFFNLFNQSTALNKGVNLVHPNSGLISLDPREFFKGFDIQALMAAQGKRSDPRYGLPSSFQPPRSILFGVHFFF